MTIYYLSIILVSLLPAVLVAWLAANYAHLKKAPGPVLAGSTDLWRAYLQYNGKLRKTLVDLHARHGPIVRYGVRSVSISDPGVISVVYGSRAGFVTADSYRVLVGIQNGKEVPSLVSTRDEARHAALRRSVANAFTQNAALDYERWIDLTIADLLATLADKSTFDLAAVVLYYTMDAAGRFAFGAPLGCLATQSDVDGSIQLIRDRFNHWGWWGSIPGLERLVFRNPIAMRQKKAPSSMAAVAVEKLKARASRPDAAAEAGQVDLLQRFLDAREDYPEALDAPGIVGMLMSTISGAGDTTATAITAALYNLMRHPAVLKKLEAELDGLPEIPAYAETSRLPYLNAVIRESMRLLPSANWPIERLVPEGGVSVAGMFFPAGTSIGCFPPALHLNTSVYGEDAHDFRPERWLAADREKLRLMEATHMGFSRGRRVCLGQHIAVMSMKKAIPALLMKYKLSLVDPNAELDVDFSPAVPYLHALWAKSEPK